MMPPGKRILYFLFILSSLIACNPQTEKPLRVGTVPWAGYELLYLARDLHYYNNAQIQLKELASSTEVMHAFRQGQLDMVATTLDGALRMAETQSDIKIILIFNISNGADKLMVEPTITSLKALKGKRVGVEQSGVGAYMMSQVLQLAGLDRKDITIIPTTVNQHSSLLTNQLVDAVISFDPVAYKLQQQGYINLFDSRQLPAPIVDVLVTRDSALTLQKKNIQQLLEGYWQARDYMAKNPQDAFIRIAPRLDISTEELELLYQQLILPEREHQQNIFNQQLKTIIESVAKMMIEVGLLEKKLDSRQLLIDETMDL
jgi:NitT/TauT family transport system substrate-binding protein